MPGEHRITVHLDEPIGMIRPALYGHFAEHLGTCVDEGLWVGEASPIENIGGLRTDVIEALRRIRVPVLRWPGGCFADTYHWEDGIGPRKDRPRRVNLWWGQTLETNGFGTHEFMNLCRLIGAEPYLAGNLGSGSPRELGDWVEYCNFAGDSTLARRRGTNGSPAPFGVKHWGIGNEAWGCGGNQSAPEYASSYRRFSTYVRELSGTSPQLIAVGPDCGGRPNYHADWTRQFLQALNGYDRIDGLAAHYYCGTAGTATHYSVEQWYELLERAARVEEVIRLHRGIMDEFDPHRKIGLILDEWGTWHPPTPGRNPSHLWQQNTLRDALVAAITLDTFNRTADVLVMANLAQLVNVLQAPILTEGPRMILTPTFHVLEMYRQHQGAQSLRLSLEAEPIRFVAEDARRELAGLSGSASIKHGLLTLSLVNPHAHLPADITVELRGGGELRDVQATVLCDEDLTAHNSFDEPNRLIPRASQSSDSEHPLRRTLPPASVTVIRGQLGGT